MSKHDWRPMFDSEPYQAPDRARWCGVCGERALSVAATEAFAPCEGAPADPVLSVKGIKSFRGMSGIGFNASLYENGKRLGLVIDEGSGGSYLYRIDREKRDEFERWARVHKQKGIEALDAVLAELVGTFEENAKFKRICKKKTVAFLKSDPEGHYSMWPVPYTPAFAARLRKEHDVVEIVNERFLVTTDPTQDAITVRTSDANLSGFTKAQLRTWLEANTGHRFPEQYGKATLIHEVRKAKEAQEATA